MVVARDTPLRASAATNADPEVAASAEVPAVQPAVRLAPPPRVEAPVTVAASTRAQAPRVVSEKPNRIEVAASPAVESSLSPIESNQPADQIRQAPVTITGCLEVTSDGDEFRLTDTEGEGAPTARGWRSGFLRKRPAPIELSALRDPAAARRYVGHRVVATGVLSSRALRVRSLQSAGSVCD
jgi:hypothetical protein